ncbi:hypothetical protein H7X69_03195 [Candidatus Saccharibacteria bacterium]|nr:hypothetical protein [Candidatus Saccharibacteria bacterium]
MLHTPVENNPVPNMRIYDELAFAYNNAPSVGLDSPLYYQERAKQALTAEINLTNRKQVNERASAIEAARQYAIDSTLFVYEQRGLRTTGVDKILKTLIGGNFAALTSLATPKDLTSRELIQRESLIGSEIFAPPVDGGQRTFFYSDAQEWVWHEASIQESVTTRYLVQEQGVLKIQDGAPQYEFIEGKELENFVRATEVYHGHVMSRIYNHTGQTDYTQAA